MTQENEQLIDLDQIQERGLQELQAVESEEALAQWRIAHLGRQSAVMQVFTRIPQVDKSLRPALGQRANLVKTALETALAERAQAIKEQSLRRSIETEQLDVTLPGRAPVRGRLHPQTHTLREIYRVFGDMGFQVYDSPDVETDEYNFELLNIPAYHPARDLWDTFHTDRPGVILRTHTSPGQMRVMRAYCPEPIRAILPGMCYRYEPINARSEIQFNQIELLVVGKDVTFQNLRATLDDFARRMFGQNVRTRLRPSYFPFTEPSAEMDIECFVCGGKGCVICKSSGWLEILGCGMVHPTVLTNGGYDPEIYSGFAAGMGPERISLLRYAIDDIRNFWQNDVRFLEQF